MLLIWVSATDLGVIPCQTFARLREVHTAHEAHKEVDWMQSAMGLLGYAVYDERRSGGH